MIPVRAAAEKNIKSVMGSNISMDMLTFPKNEWEDIKNRLDAGKVVFTIRGDHFSCAI